MVSRANRGTPPRARGRPVEVRERPATIGNTPACAGKTSSRKQQDLTPWEHPRVRGEDIAPINSRYSFAGTPPRARGRQVNYFEDELAHGNTPACAGKTP